MSQRPRASLQKQSEYAKQMATDFEATLLHNKVWDDLDEDHQLARLCDAAVAADHAADARAHELGEEARFVANIESATAKLGWVSRQRAVEAVAEVCAEVVQEADGWTDAWDDAEITAAKREAREWLQLHTNAATRAGVLGEQMEDYL